MQDTVGCGDSFAAAVVLGYTRGHAIPPVMALANAVRVLVSQGRWAKLAACVTAATTCFVLAVHAARLSPAAVA